MDPNQSIDARERVRRSYNKHRVNNPFDKDYSTVWDGFHHVVKAHSFAILEEFLANKWLEEQCIRIITEEADNAVKSENERRRTNNQLPMDRTRKTGEQLEFESPYYAGWRQKFPEVVKKYGLYGGMVEEYGMQYLPSAAPENRQIARSLIEDLSTEPVAPQMAPAPKSGPLEPNLIDDLQGKTQFELRKIARDRGIETAKTDKKEELIKMLSQ